MSFKNSLREPTILQKAEHGAFYLVVVVAAAQLGFGCAVAFPFG